METREFIEAQKRLIHAVRERDMYMIGEPLAQTCCSKCSCDRWIIRGIKERQEETL